MHRPLTFNGASGLLVRIWLPGTGLIVLLPFMAHVTWVMDGIWIVLTFAQVRQEDSLVLTSPISQVQLLYVRLGVATALVEVMSSLDPLGRLLGLHVAPHVVSALLGFTIALLTLVVVKLLRWHRVRHFRRLPWIAIAMILLSYVVATWLAIVPNPLNLIMAQWPAHLVVSALGVAIALLLWLLARETRETDHYPGLINVSTTS